ncbi:MAG TPA: TonB-dependent receptor, partial [Crocinitomicaceae bacterium]|nr:TonB-dependent receptor [Crocinitomicaceae bacterium]
MKYVFIFALLVLSFSTHAQHTLNGIVLNDGSPVPFAKVKIKSQNAFGLTDDEGIFKISNLKEGEFEIEVFSYGLDLYFEKIRIPSESITIDLISSAQEVEEMVVSGTLKEISKKESTVNIEVYSTKFFKKNPSPTIYDAMQNINGVRPQLNCNICNTGDIHINGLEGPYTMILIDGMPIVSSLSTVYGLSGIPNSLVERIEIVKGPASTLYGSEAIGGVINIITKNAQTAPLLSVDLMTTSWLETSADIALKTKIGKKANVLTGINYFKYGNKRDDNNDGFTDVTLQDRISIFQKWNFKRKDYRLLSIAARYLYEDRWGGEMNFTSDYRGGDSIYG